MTTTRYALRLDVQTDWQSRVSAWCSSNADGFIVAFEAAGEDNKNLHIHAILDSLKSVKVLRQSLTRAFPESVGNKGYSLKLCNDDYDAYIRYICKGEDKHTQPVIWCHQGLLYTDRLIQEAHEKYWVNNESLKENAKKRAKVDSMSIIDQVEAEAKKLGYKGFQREDVARIYIRLFKDARKGINVFAARAVVNTVCCLLEGSCQELLASKIADL